MNSLSPHNNELKSSCNLCYSIFSFIVLSHESAVQWYYPIWSEWVFSDLIIGRSALMFTNIISPRCKTWQRSPPEPCARPIPVFAFSWSWLRPTARCRGSRWGSKRTSRRYDLSPRHNGLRRPVEEQEFYVISSVASISCGQSYKQFTSVNFLVSSTLES